MDEVDAYVILKDVVNGRSNLVGDIPAKQEITEIRPAIAHVREMMVVGSLIAIDIKVGLDRYIPTANSRVRSRLNEVDVCGAFSVGVKTVVVSDDIVLTEKVDIIFRRPVKGVVLDQVARSANLKVS